MIHTRPTRIGKSVRSLFSRDAGQALLELGLTIPLFILLLYGAVELGRVAFASIAVSNAAEAGALFGSQNTAYASNTGAIQAAAVADAGSISISTPVVTTTCGCSDGSVSGSSCTSFNSCVSPVETVETLTVTTTTTFDPLVHFPGFPKSYTLNGSAIHQVLY